MPFLGASVNALTRRLVLYKTALYKFTKANVICCAVYLSFATVLKRFKATKITTYTQDI
jgi:hypothetical protein